LKPAFVVASILTETYDPALAHPSTVGPLFLAIFGLPFLCFGLFGVLLFLTSSPVIHRSGSPVPGASFSAVFPRIGAGLMLGTACGSRQLK